MKLYDDICNVLNQLSTVSRLLNEVVDLERRVRDDPDGPETFGPLLARVRNELHRRMVGYQSVVSNVGLYLGSDASTRAVRLIASMDQILEDATRLQRSGSVSHGQLADIISKRENISMLFNDTLDCMRRLQGEIFEKLEASSPGALPQPGSGVAAPATPAARYRFKKEGNTWTIRFDDESTSIADIDGMKYIHFLLCRPGKPLSALQVYQAVKPPGRDSETIRRTKEVAQEIEETGARDQSRRVGKKAGAGVDDALDPQAIAQIRSRLREIPTLIEEFQSSLRAETLENRKSDLREAIASLEEEKNRIESSIDNKPKHFRHELDKPRKAVSNCIERAKEKFRQSMPKFYNHISNYLVTGTHMVYNGSDIEWEV